jgi:hypothetical protein
MEPSSEPLSQNLEEEVPLSSPDPLFANKSSTPVSNSVVKTLPVSPASPRVVVSLKSCSKEIDSIKSLPESQHIVNSLIERQQIVDLKLNNYRMAEKAQRVSEMRDVPEINSLSRKIIEQKNKSINDYEDRKCISPVLKKETSEPKLYKKDNEDGKLNKKQIKYITDERKYQHGKGKKTNPKQIKPKFESILDSPLPADIFKSKEPLSPNSSKLIESNPIIKDVATRTVQWNEKKNQKIQEIKNLKLIKDMQECTFKPKLSPSNDYNNSGTMVTKHYDDKSQKRFEASKTVTQGSDFVSAVQVVPSLYSQLSPASFSVKREFGYDHKELVSRSRPMADYRQFIEDQLD